AMPAVLSANRAISSYLDGWHEGERIKVVGAAIGLLQGVEGLRQGTMTLTTILSRGGSGGGMAVAVAGAEGQQYAMSFATGRVVAVSAAEQATLAQAGNDFARGTVTVTALAMSRPPGSEPGGAPSRGSGSGPRLNEAALREFDSKEFK